MGRGKVSQGVLSSSIADTAHIVDLNSACVNQSREVVQQYPPVNSLISQASRVCRLVYSFAHQWLTLILRRLMAAYNKLRSKLITLESRTSTAKEIRPDNKVSTSSSASQWRVLDMGHKKKMKYDYLLGSQI